MKKLSILASLFMGLALLSGCSDDNDSNPTLNVPDTFTLNEPELKNYTYDLAKADGITLTWTQPDYGYTAAVTYYAQVSLDNTWKDAEGGSMATYAEVDGSVRTCKATFASNLVDEAIMKAGLIDDPANVPAEDTIYIRLRATVGAGDTLYSNSVKVAVKPYYVELSSDPVLWYLVGDCIGDGNETNEGTANVGVSLIPLSAVDGTKYNFVGSGEFTYTDYFPANGKFRLLKTPGETDASNFFGSADGSFAGATLGNDGYFTIPSDGYYTISLNSKTNTLTVAAASSTPKEYGVICIAGSINSWSTSVTMTPANQHSSVNHVWTYDYDFSVNDEVKFLSDYSWDTNWGNSAFPYGFGTNGGDNIKVTTKGKYRIVFNDVTGFYTFIALSNE